jgi:site-specific recombinase XerD
MTAPTQVIYAQTVITDDLKAHWRKAIELWLASRHSASTRRAYAAALEDILASTGKGPMEIRRADVLDWVNRMRKRGLADSTIKARISGVSSFYRFCMREYTLESGDGSEIGLAKYNPADGESIRPKVELYGKGTYLDVEEAKALITTVIGGLSSKNPRTRVRCLRNYALFIGYMLTGRRNSEWRCVRWKDFEFHKGRCILRWAGKGKKDQRLEVPEVVWQAIKSYLQSAGEFPLQGDQYIFVRLGGDRTRPLAAEYVRDLLKRYAKKALLDPGRIRVHTLRHTAAYLMQEAGDGLQEISRFLGHSNISVTQVYLHKFEGPHTSNYGRVADLLGL